MLDPDNLSTYNCDFHDEPGGTLIIVQDICSRRLTGRHAEGWRATGGQELLDTVAGFYEVWSTAEGRCSRNTLEDKYNYCRYQQTNVNLMAS